MFTGIVQAQGTVLSLQTRQDGARLVVDTALPPESLKLGDSIAVDGVCQTIAVLDGSRCTFHCLQETLRRTIFGEYTAGQKVNIEPALAVGDRLGGHIVQGHVDCAERVMSVAVRDGDRVLTIHRPDPADFPLVMKGSVTINGVSLTVAKCTAESFSVCLIPHTWEHTDLHLLKNGSRVNLEADIVGRYLADFQKHTSNISLETLRNAGF